MAYLGFFSSAIVLTPMPQPGIEPTSVELHRTRGTFWSTLCGLSYTAVVQVHLLKALGHVAKAWQDPSQYWHSNAWPCFKIKGVRCWLFLLHPHHLKTKGKMFALIFSSSFFSKTLKWTEKKIQRTREVRESPFKGDSNKKVDTSF